MSCQCGDIFEAKCGSAAITGGEAVLATFLLLASVIVHRLGACCAADGDASDSDDEAAAGMYSYM